MLRLIRNARLTNLSSSRLFVLPQRCFTDTHKGDQTEQVKTAAMDGSEACANAAYSLSEAAFIYPITPSTAMSEAFDAWSVAGRKSLIGEMPVAVYEMQSEGGAAGAMHGAAVSGSLATTFTASQGLLLMIPNLYQFSGELLPGVFHVAARSLTKQALSIFGDHQDVMACRQTGVALLCSSNPQEAQDLAIIAHISTLKTRIPFLHFFDGWRTSSVVHKIKLVPDEQLTAMYPYQALETNLRNTGINIDEANMRGTAQGPDIYFQSLVANNKYYRDAPGIINEVMQEFSAVTGRQYELFQYMGPKDAERCIIMMGSGSDTAQQTIDHMNTKGEKVGLLKVRLYRPWSSQHFLNALPSSVRKIAVLDRTREDGALAEPLQLDVTTALNDGGRLKDIDVLTGGQYGLSSKEFTPSMVRAVYNNLNVPNPMKRYVIGIDDDVTHTSLSYSEFDLVDNDTSLPANTTQCMFWGMGGDGTVGANKQSIKDLSDNTDLFVQANFSYDAHKSGGVTCSHLRFGPNPIKAEYEIQKADYISVNHCEWIKRFDQIVNKARFNATLVINSPWDSLEDMNDNVPDLIKKQIAIKNIELYNIDAGAVANKVGLGKRINLIMQSVFYKLSGVLPVEEAMELMVNGIKKVYHDKGPKVIDMNIKGVEVGLAYLKRIEYPQNEWATLKTGDKIENVGRDYSENTPKFVREILYSMNDLTANALPVSAFMEGGIVPKSTSRFEKRAISATIPQWDGDKCTQCNYCSLVCPHAVIRPFLLNKQEIVDAPSGYQSKKTKPAVAGTNYSIQIAPMDCTGCEVCTVQCPDDALTMVSYHDHMGTQLRDWEYSINHVTNKAKQGLVGKGADRLTVKGSQFHEPLCEFHGACGGCGESPYLKLMTQMFGKNVVIANATGCSSIWGASAPNNPYSIPWANSLFEDNAEFGYGIASATNKRREHLLMKLSGADANKFSTNVMNAVSDWISSYSDIQKNNIASDQLLAVLKEENIGYHELLGSDRNMLKKASQWIVGGDGWAYDIGFGGLDHVFAQSHNTNVNILVLDTEMYSNTGGQASKSTPTGASVKFAEGGQQTNKKDLGQIAMLYQNIYVASIALGADYEQTVTAFKEAEQYDGISLIVALAPCIDWGIDMKQMMNNQKMAVDTGYWPLYRYDPRKSAENNNPFQLDSKRIREDLEKYLKLQNRFGKLERAQPEVADKLHNKLEKHYKSRHERLIRTSLDDEDYFSYLQQKLGVAGGLMEDKEQILVLYGSETGNARNLSDIINYELKRRNTNGNLQIKMMAMDDYDFNDLLELTDDENTRELNVIFAISTCGQGEFPKNCQYFMKDLLGAELKGRSLSNKINYAVFGLGDSNYVYYNEAAKILDATLHKMGANQLIEVGLGNDQDEDQYDTAYEEWSPSLYGTMNLEQPSSELMESTLYIEMFNESDDVIQYIPEGTNHVPIKSNLRLTDTQYDRDFRHYEFDITQFKNELAFDVGDCLGISPINDIKQIETLCDLYNIKQSDVVNINNEYNINVYDLFARKLDVAGKPKRPFYELLSQVASDEKEKEYLLNLLNDKSFEKEFKRLRNGDTSTYIDLLLKFKSCRPSLNYLIEHIPEIKQRLYSIANSPAMHPNQIDLFVIKDDWFTESDNVYREGITTKYLEGLNEGDRAYAKIHGASVAIADNHSAPLLLTGLGSGLAPLRAHIQDRVFAKSKGENVGECALIFGSRNRKNEYFYKDELEEYHSNGKGVLTRLLPAFSRDQKDKYYVTDRLREEKKMVYDYLIEKNGYFYYCGTGGNVPENVKNEVVQSFIQHGNMNEDQARQKVVELQLSGHYNVEAW